MRRHRPSFTKAAASPRQVPKKTLDELRKDMEARQNPAKDWQHWLKPGSLCKPKFALCFDVLARRFTDDVRHAVRDWGTGVDNKVADKDTLIVCLGELKRSNKRDQWTGKMETTVVWHFFSPLVGSFVAEPDWFLDATEDDTKS